MFVRFYLVESDAAIAGGVVVREETSLTHNKASTPHRYDSDEEAFN